MPPYPEPENIFNVFISDGTFQGFDSLPGSIHPFFHVEVIENKPKPDFEKVADLINLIIK